ncbi:MAG: hypothetical protein JO029_09525 [Candidatus Eremiobacteraeota bacterium]|nr:hypothetical protein [Candidatus Eremiobacteraeota bacterium]MBV8284592.1 hypothetical protein [Candidatus Eremiobacteraeota bacterium]MBV8434503.1 hypothetical protein [Candidatus Eremiobacteraeota bacterium]MBV8583356.1 hypothetical protein [Candidatus Eremiobacteraeota bacterium]
MKEDLVLAREVDARRALRGRKLRLALLAPLGPWLGRGALRVLRVRDLGDDFTELLTGYESYERLA